MTRNPILAALSDVAEESKAVKLRIAGLTKAVERAEQRAYPGRAFPQVEDESDLQSMLDGLMSEHERGN